MIFLSRTHPSIHPSLCCLSCAFFLSFLLYIVVEYFNIYSNQFTGTIPDHLRLRNLFYFDVGRNLLTGKLPSDLGESFVSLRHLHLDHNDFRGTIPSSYNTVGNGRLESFSLNHNRLTGTVPGDREHYNKLVQYTLHENRFSRIQINNCRLEVPQGECVEFRYVVCRIFLSLSLSLFRFCTVD